MNNFIAITQHKNSFSQDLAITLVSSDDEFPVNFDDAWLWLGFATKASAKRKLTNFLDGVDFFVSRSKPSTGGRPSEAIYLTVACFEKMKAYQEARRSKKQYEKLIQQSLLSRKGGQIEVSTPVGNIDLLTNSEVIEIKDKSNWKSALGQVIAYGYYYPSHQKTICLFGSAHSQFKRTVEDVCTWNNIRVEWVNN